VDVESPDIAVLIRHVVRDVVTDIAPEEKPFVVVLQQLDDDAVVRRLRRRRRRREPLGFGFDDLAALVTPVVWIALTEAAKRMGTVAADGAATGLKGVLGRIRRRKQIPTSLPPLTDEQRGTVRQAVLETCRRRGVREKKATEIADAVVNHLTPDP
jgi:hypothetical protein